MKTEQEFSDQDAKPQLGKTFSVQSFENSSNQSTPDLYLVQDGRGYSIWVELKVEAKGAVSFMPGQCKWLETHAKRGGLAYVLCLHAGDFVALYASGSARWLSTTRRIEEAPARQLVGGPLRLPSTWQAIARAILDDADTHWGRS